MLLIGWQLKDRPVVVIGGGEVATGRIEAAVKAGAKVTVISPTVSPAVQKLIDSRLIDKYHKRLVKVREDLGPKSHYEMCFSAIDDRKLSHRIYLACKKSHIPVNVADIPPECDFYFGSMIERGPLQVMVSTGGQAPRLARKIRSALEERVDELRVEGAIERIGTLRTRIREKTTQPPPGAATDSEFGYDKDTIATRMKWISNICDRLTFNQMAALTDEDIDTLVNQYPN